ncbi:metalloendoproteinase 3-MMP-like [Argentina anserina]|uniref:metalloendoproteinase 3-MMP-like n=1 Tax=Argentina anserina TaxID=57926 RepID=UPI0021767EA6|nr:metalloendoproteinase 3-MMP-like [Potentilla anserina]
MTPKSDISLFIVTLLLLLLTLFSFLSNASAKEPLSKSSSPFKFIEHLKGCHKGDRVKGINELKKYLHKFGYLNYKNHVHFDTDDFDELLEEAIKTYQLNFHLKATGVLDDKTVSKMMMPRCGMPDIINFSSSMRSTRINRGSIHINSVHYSFPDGNPKWSSAKFNLTYGFLASTPSQAMGPVAKAFATWAKNTHFKFSKAQSGSADLKISFERRAHGDQYPFNGPGGELAHAFYPPDGRLHYDAEESWSAGPKPGTYDLESVALHEIGHLLGLGHSSIEGAAMYPIIPEGQSLSLKGDDLQGIKALYG